MLSLTGIPPTAGFWGKFYLFSAVIDAGYTWLAILAVVMSAVSAFYYLRVVWYMYFEPASADAAAASTPEASAARQEPVESGTASPASAEAGPGAVLPEADTGTGAAMLVAALGVLFIGVWPQGLLWAAEGAVRLLSGG
jgi:NADH:ubiquinone oxidoreductase subunit 2 (subunit N)